MTPTRPNAILAVLATTLALAACGGNPVRDVAVAAGVTGGEPKAAPDFVSSSRPGSADYIPVGTAAPKRVYRPKTASEVSKSEADLDQARARNEKLGAGAGQQGQSAKPQ